MLLPPLVRLLSEWCAGDPAELDEERVREYFLHLVREKGLAPQTVRQARAALVAAAALIAPQPAVCTSVKTTTLILTSSGAPAPTRVWEIQIVGICRHHRGI